MQVQIFTKDTEKKTRAERRRQAKAEEKARRQADRGKKSKPSVQSQRNEELRRKAEEILSGILAEMGDIDRFDDAREIQKLGGMGLVACSSGKHKGETKISRRGRKRLRYWLFQAAKSAVAHSAGKAFIGGRNETI